MAQVNKPVPLRHVQAVHAKHTMLADRIYHSNNLMGKKADTIRRIADQVADNTHPAHHRGGAAPCGPQAGRALPG